MVKRLDLSQTDRLTTRKAHKLHRLDNTDELIEDEDYSPYISSAALDVRRGPGKRLADGFAMMFADDE